MWEGVCVQEIDSEVSDCGALSCFVIVPGSRTSTSILRRRTLLIGHLGRGGNVGYARVYNGHSGFTPSKRGKTDHFSKSFLQRKKTGVVGAVTAAQLCDGH